MSSVGGQGERDRDGLPAGWYRTSQQYRAELRVGPRSGSRDVLIVATQQLVQATELPFQSCLGRQPRRFGLFTLTVGGAGPLTFELGRGQGLALMVFGAIAFGFGRLGPPFGRFGALAFQLPGMLTLPSEFERVGAFPRRNPGSLLELAGPFVGR